MKKIPTLFKRNPENRQKVIPEWDPRCEWVREGKGVATRKYDGTCCLFREGRLWKRRELKKGQDYPVDFQLEQYDEVTQKTVGWVPVLDIPENRWHIEAYKNRPADEDSYWPDGTYELCGPKIQGNPEGFDRHVFIKHSLATPYPGVVRTFEGIRDFLSTMDIEGLVFHHPCGLMAKIKKRDF